MKIYCEIMTEFNPMIWHFYYTLFKTVTGFSQLVFHFKDISDNPISLCHMCYFEKRNVILKVLSHTFEGKHLSIIQLSYSHYVECALPNLFSFHSDYYVHNPYYISQSLFTLWLVNLVTGPYNYSLQPAKIWSCFCCKMSHDVFLTFMAN